MSLYNMVCGLNDGAEILLKCAGLSMDDVPRFRDVYMKDGLIAIYTRTGGENRDDYEAENGALASRPNYVRDYDDDYDATYAHFEFEPLPEHKDFVSQLCRNDPTPGEKFQAVLDALRAR